MEEEGGRERGREEMRGDNGSFQWSIIATYKISLNIPLFTVPDPTAGELTSNSTSIMLILIESGVKTASFFLQVMTGEGNPVIRQNRAAMSVILVCVGAEVASMDGGTVKRKEKALLRMYISNSTITYHGL